MFKVNSGHYPIQFHIDNVEYFREQKRAVITGWVFSASDVEIKVSNKYCTEYKIQKIKRADVAHHFNIERNDIGFSLEANFAKSVSNITLEFLDDEKKKSIKIKLFNRFAIFNSKSLYHFKTYSSQYGVLAAIKHTVGLFLHGPKSYSETKIDLNAQYQMFLKQEQYIHHTKVKYSYQPKISILVPVYNVPEKWLRVCLDSVINQTYNNWELCIVDDCSPNKNIIKVLEEYSQEDSRIKYYTREVNGHISAASNDALQMATGDYIALLDHDDELAPTALEEVIKKLNENQALDLIYTDEDKIDENGIRFDPHFKPDWSPETLLSMNYICHFTVIRRSLVKEVGGFNLGYEGAQDYDLFLRITEKTNNIYHIPKVLYHWRTLDTSTAKNMSHKDYAYYAGEKAIKDALKRRGLLGHVNQVGMVYSVDYDVIKQDKVSIIIPTKDYADVLKVCLDSIYNKSTYSNFEIIVVNNNSSESKTFELFKEYKEKYTNFKVMDNNIKFNYSKLNNDAVNVASGEYLILLNNDIEIITPNWIELMLGYCQQSHIGAVGAKLLYPDNTVQHCGVTLGIGGVAGHLQKYAERNDFGYYNRLVVPYNYAAVTAACLMVSKDNFIEVCGLDEKLEVAFNDVDFNIKLLQSGYYNVILPQVEAYHHESKSRGHEDTPEKVARFQKETKYMKDKWPQYLSRDPFYNDNLSLYSEQIQIKKVGK